MMGKPEAKVSCSKQAAHSKPGVLPLLPTLVLHSEAATSNQKGTFIIRNGRAVMADALMRAAFGRCKPIQQKVDDGKCRGTQNAESHSLPDTSLYLPLAQLVPFHGAGQVSLSAPTLIAMGPIAFQTCACPG